ncbi:MAG: alanine racemase [Corallococcus sp.]|nr:alanine racemase [Corallococcus sp.]
MLCAVVKNNAYGHGLEHVSMHLARTVDCFAVGSAEEAARIACLKKDTIILLPQDYRNTAQAVNNGSILTLDSFSTFDIIDNVAGTLRRKAAVHIKIDSGMSRLGFAPCELPLLIQKLCVTDNINVLGVYSHFGGDKRKDCDSQFDIFSHAAEMLERELQMPLLKHVANTAATLSSSKYHMDMARVGLGLYGYGGDSLVSVKRVVADVIAVKRVDKGAVVGYGGLYKCARDTQIAVLNIGYANGLPRILVGSDVLINGKRCKIAAICMAMSMIDAGDDCINIGDKAQFLGDGLNAQRKDVSIYELLCKLN